MTEQDFIFSWGLSADNAIGIVAEVSVASVEVRFGEPFKSNGSVAPSRGVRVPEVNTYIAIVCGEYAVFSQLARVQVSDFGPAKPGQAAVPSVWGQVKLLATIDLRSGEVSAGTLTSPHIGDIAYIAPPELTKLVIQGNRASSLPANALVMKFARLPDGTILNFTPEMIFGRHCAVLGSSGGGKSWTLSRMIEETSHYNSKVVLFDATGEYYRLKNGVRHAYLGEEGDPNESASEVVLPYYQLTERDLFAIFKPDPETQAPKLREAIKSLKVAALDQSLAPDGTIVKVHKAKKPYEAALEQFRQQLENPFAEFDIRKLARQVENECVSAQRSTQESNVWGDINGTERAACTPLVTRIQDLLRSTSLAPIFNPGTKRSVLREISSFVRDEDAKVLRLSLRSLSFAHHAREIITNATGRFLLDVAREGRFREQPMLIFLDEAHQFLNKALQSEDEVYPLDSFGLIAKEGRKYALNICIATQRPRDIPDGVLSQIGTLLVHRLSNDQDRLTIERATGAIDRSTLEQLPSLVPGEALLVGIDFPVPLTVRIDRPQYEPDSMGPDYQRFWRARMQQ